MSEGAVPLVPESGGLSDDCVVIQGWKSFERGRATTSAKINNKTRGFYCLSVGAARGRSAEYVSNRWGYDGKWYRESTVGAIRSLGEGFDVVPDGAVHALLLFPRKPGRNPSRDRQWDAIEGAFTAPAKLNPNCRVES